MNALTIPPDLSRCRLSLDEVDHQSTMATRKKSKVLRGDQNPKALAGALRKLAGTVYSPGPYDDLWYVLHAFANAIDGGELKKLGRAVSECTKYCREAPDHGSSWNKGPIAIEPLSKPDAYADVISDLDSLKRGELPASVDLRSVIYRLEYLIGLIDSNLLKERADIDTWLDRCEAAAKAQKIWSPEDLVVESLRLAGVHRNEIDKCKVTHERYARKANEQK